jgi:osmoprotectant transport system permease protein
MTNTRPAQINWKILFIPVLIMAAGALFSYYVVTYPQDSIVQRYVSYDKILKLLGQHILLVLISGGAAIATSVPLGILFTRTGFKQYSNIIVNVINIGQTIPSLAILALFVGILGLGFKPAIFALWLYSLLPILNNTLAGILGVNKSILEAARGMGMRPIRILAKIELPLAFPVIMAGIRTAVTINIGTATLAAFIGAGGLGDLIVAGNNINRWQIYVLGAVLSALLAILTDFLLGLFEAHLKKM